MRNRKLPEGMNSYKRRRPITQEEEMRIRLNARHVTAKKLAALMGRSRDVISDWASTNGVRFGPPRKQRAVVQHKPPMRQSVQTVERMMALASKVAA